MSTSDVSPQELAIMSAQLGIDMTPNCDLEERLDSVIALSTACQNDLDKLMRTVESYARTVKGLSISELRAAAAEVASKNP